MKMRRLLIILFILLLLIQLTVSCLAEEENSEINWTQSEDVSEDVSEEGEVCGASAGPHGHTDEGTLIGADGCALIFDEGGKHCTADSGCFDDGSCDVGDFLAVAETDEMAALTQQVVKDICAECVSMGFETEYEMALWCHDKLITMATYDYTYTYYDASGVLVHHTGVCESYAMAFALLMEGMGFEHEVVISIPMNHAWNIVRLDGIWCHVDCTWDDPGTGGQERRDYFGLSDEWMGLDHTWNREYYQPCTSDENSYGLRHGELIRYFSARDLRDKLSLSMEMQADHIRIYDGMNSTFMPISVYDLVVEELQKVCADYQCTLANGVRYDDQSLTIKLKYITETTLPAANQLESLIDCPALTVQDGQLDMKRYDGKNAIIVEGYTSCSYTNGFLRGINAASSILNREGVSVIAIAMDKPSAERAAAFAAQYPNFKCCFPRTDEENSAVFRLRGCYSTWSENYPCVYLKDSSNRLVYHCSGSIDEPLAVAATALAMKKTAVKAKTLSFSESRLSLSLGDTRQIEYSVEPSTASNRLSWRSSNSEIVSVDENGLITAVAGGKALIMGETRDGSGLSCSVTVEVTAWESAIEPMNMIRCWFKDQNGSSVDTDDYAEDAVIYLFGKSTSSATRQLIEKLHRVSDKLDESGVKVIVIYYDNPNAKTISSCITVTGAREFIFTSINGCSSEFWTMYQHFGHNGSVSWPCIFVQNTGGQLIYCDAGSSVDETLVTSLACSLNAQNLEEEESVLTLPSMLSTVETGAFEGLSGITKVVFEGNACSEIDDFAFRYCFGLREIDIPDSVTVIGSDVFKDCPDLVIHCGSGSAAQSYAEENGIAYVLND